MWATVALLVALLPAMVGAQAPAAGSAPSAPRQAVLQGLDKVTARVSTFTAEIGRPVRFGTLEITLRLCHNRPPDETPESAAFLVVGELRANAEPRPVFSGWMFASSPALSALEHPVYDVWIKECR